MKEAFPCPPVTSKHIAIFLACIVHHRMMLLLHYRELVTPAGALDDVGKEGGAHSLSPVPEGILMKIAVEEMD